MKKIFLLLSIFAVCLFTSCSNDWAAFDDKDAFVAFGKASYAIAEDGGTLSIPVTLASAAGIQTSVTVSGVDGTAKSGVNYNIKNGGVLSFDANNRTANVEIEIINQAGVYTGDLRFTLQFSNLGSVNAGLQSTTSVTVQDKDHPLSPILGAYKATAFSYFDNAFVNYTMTFIKDASDDSKVWIDNFFGNDGWKGDDMLVYGVVDGGLTTITMPFGQTSEYVYSNGEAVVFYGVDINLETYDVGEGNWTITIKDGGAKMSVDYGVYAYIPGAGGLSCMLPGIELVKQ